MENEKTIVWLPAGSLDGAIAYLNNLFNEMVASQQQAQLNHTDGDNAPLILNTPVQTIQQ